MCKITPDYSICLSCFHISKLNTITNVPLYTKANRAIIYNDVFLQYLFRELEDLIGSKNKINIASVDGFDTIILDLIKSRFSGDVKTTSISEKFNPSYFSDHKCYKLSLDMYTSMDNYDKFDVIILNSSLDYISDPISLLKRCKMICNNDGCIYTMNLHVSILLSFDYINTVTEHIWSTHSVKKLCKYSELLLSDTYKVPILDGEVPLPYSNYRIYKILNCDNNDDEWTTKILEDVYDEICKGFYDIESYRCIKKFWSLYMNL
jgi:SAM-dependent methyltransferase